MVPGKKVDFGNTANSPAQGRDGGYHATTALGRLWIPKLLPQHSFKNLGKKSVHYFFNNE